MTFAAFEARAVAMPDLVILDQVAYNAALAQSAGYVVALRMLVQLEKTR